MMTPIVGFAPDADPTTPGVVTDCEHLIPYLTGMEGAPSAVVPVGVPAFASESRGLALVNALDGSRRLIAGTESTLLELTSTTWTDVSAAGGYALGVEGRWTITGFGNATLAANKSVAIQRSAVGVFSAIAGAPKADVIFPVGAFVMALNFDDGTDNPDGWHCCAAFDETDWTPSITTQAAKGRLVASPGVLTAGARLGEYAVAYKSKGIFLGQYVGAPSIWDWTPVPGGTAGCVGKEALCDVGNVHFFVGEDDFYLFDGTVPKSVADNQVRQWFYDNSSQLFRYRTKCIFDKQNDRVWVFYPSKNSEQCDSALVWHVKSGKWGRANRVIQSALNYINPPVVSYDTLGFSIPTYNDVPNVSYDSQYWVAGGRTVSVVNSSNQLVILDGVAGASSLTTGEYGDDDQVSLLTKVRLRYADAPDSATCTTSYSFNSGNSFTTGSTGTLNDGKFDVLQTGRWHKARFDFSGDVRVTALGADYKPAGTR